MSDFDLDALLTRAPEHPSELALDEWIAGVLRGAAATEVEAHCAGCATCQAYVATARRGLAAVPGLDADAAFGRVLRGIEAARPAPASAPSGLRSWLARLFSPVGLTVMAGAAAAVVVLLARGPDPGGPVGPDPGDGVRMKGDLALEVARKTPDGVQAMVSGDAFRPDDELRFLVTLPTAGRVAIVGIEADGALYTAWPLPGMDADPQQPAGKAQPLPGAVRLDGKPGTETLHLVLCPPDIGPGCTSDGADAPPRCPPGCRSVPFLLRKVAP